MPDRIGVRPANGQHELFIGLRTLNVTGGQLLRFSRLIPTYLRRVALEMSPKSMGGLQPILPVPVREIRLNEDVLGTQVHLSIDDVAGGSFDYAIDPARARELGQRLIARAIQIEAAARGQQSH